LRECVDHAARARVKNAALERDARRVGALELDRARRAGLCVTRGARTSWLWKTAMVVARPAGDPLARGRPRAIARTTRRARASEMPRSSEMRVESARSSSITHGARGCASSSRGGLARRGVEDNPRAKGHCLVSLEFPRRRCRTDRPLTSRPRERRSTRAASRGSRSAPSRGRRREKRRRDRVDSAATIDERHRRAPRGGGFGASEGTRA